MTIRILTFTFRTDVFRILQCYMDNFPFIAVHRFQDDSVAFLFYPSRKTQSQLLQRFFPAVAVIFNVEHNEMPRFFSLIGCQIGKILEGIQSLTMFANEDTEIFSMEMKNNFIRLDHFFNHDLHTHILQDFLEKFPCFGSRFFGCKIFFLICCFICRRSSCGILCVISRMIRF